MLPKHLHLDEIQLPAAGEWRPATPSWRFARVVEGSGYWVEASSAREIRPSEVIVVPPGNSGYLRASQISALRLHEFQVAPEKLPGVLTIPEAAALTEGNREHHFTVRIHASDSEIAQRFGPLTPVREGTPDLGCRVECLAIAVLAWRDLGAVNVPLTPSNPPAVDRFSRLMENLCEADLIEHGPEELARLCRCSQRHLSRLFRRRFGVSIRAKQTELKLRKAQQLLSETDSKVIHVALDSGFRHLGLFNLMFKKYVGVTPSKWRLRERKKRTPSRRAGASILLAFAVGSWIAFCDEPAPKAPPPATAAAAAKTNAAPTFEVKSYQLDGNTVLPSEVVEKIFADHTGEKVSFDQIKTALAEVQLAYRGRGYVTTKVVIPQQQITNGVVHFTAIEGKLVEIRVAENRFYSSNNVLRSMPYLKTNTLLNSAVFQEELNQANANRDRQIYPELGPGPEPGTTSLLLRVKDRLPLHGKVEGNNQSPPRTPQFRVNSAMQYNNLWQLDHQVGVQYSFSPEEYKTKSQYFWEKPLVSSYSAFYRIPLKHNGLSGGPSQIQDFGYDEVTKRFRLPPSGPTPEMLFFASRSSTDTGRDVRSETLTPSILPATGGLQVSDQLLEQNLTQSEDLGARFSQPLPDLGKVKSTVSFGIDYKSYRAQTVQDRIFQANLFIPEIGSSGPPFLNFPSPPTLTSRGSGSEVNYLPLSLNWDAALVDKWGSTSFNLYQSVNVPGVFSGEKDFISATGNPDSSGSFYVLNAGIAREQKIAGEWSVSLRASGQWANEPLISNEQFGVGGTGGPRGYKEGEEYGDAGWRATIEPKTPVVDIGMVDGTMPARIRGSIFLDYGRTYFVEPHGGPDGTEMLGTGFSVSATIGELIDTRITAAWPLWDTPNSAAYTARIYFSVGFQF
jgi:hemolysin activation/secretion protein/AraC-like DNA-binding protein